MYESGSVTLNFGIMYVRINEITEFGSRAPGILVPSAEQKQSGSTHWFVSHSGDLLGSVSTPENMTQIKNSVTSGFSII